MKINLLLFTAKIKPKVVWERFILEAADGTGTETENQIKTNPN